MTTISNKQERNEAAIQHMLKYTLEELRENQVASEIGLPAPPVPLKPTGGWFECDDFPGESFLTFYDYGLLLQYGLKCKTIALNQAAEACEKYDQRHGKEFAKVIRKLLK